MLADAVDGVVAANEEEVRRARVQRLVDPRPLLVGQRLVGRAGQLVPPQQLQCLMQIMIVFTGNYLVL